MSESADKITDEQILGVVKALDEAPVPTHIRYWVDENGEIHCSYFNISDDKS